MQVYNNACGGCIYGECQVLMADGSLKKVKDIKKDDLIMSSNNVSTKVKCVIKTLCKNNKSNLVYLPEGVALTPWHPVFYNN